MDTRSQKIIRMLKLPKHESTKGLDEELRRQVVEAFQVNTLSNKENAAENLILPAIITSNDTSTATTKSISPKLPVAASIVVYENVLDISPNFKFEAEPKGSNKIKILSQINIKNPGPSTTPFDICKLNAKSWSKEKISHSLYQNLSNDQIIDGSVSSDAIDFPVPGPPSYDSWSEDKTSGSEYVPSEDSVVQNTTDEEPTTSARNNKVRENIYLKVIEKNRKRRREKKSIASSSDEEPTTSVKDIKQKEHAFIKVTRKRIHNKQERKSIAKPSMNEVPDSTTSENIEVPTSSTLTPDPLANESKNPCVEISAATKDKGKRIRNKGHACYFCQKVVQSLARHFEVMHGKEMDVAKLLAMPKNSKQRRDGFANLIRVGDFYHNCDVISARRGELILVRRPTEEESKFVKFNDYGPCPHCLGFMLKKHLWHHIKITCTAKVRGDVDKNRHVIAESDAILNNTFGAELSADFVTSISSKMRDDDIGSYCKEDNLILQFGAMQFEKYGTTQCELIRQSMRQLARFTLKLREIENSNKHLSDYLVPQKFDLIVQATKSLCVSHQNIVRRPEFEIPSLALKIGHALKKCASMKRGSCLKAGNLSGNETLMCFLHLMELEWSVRISSNALATMYNRKINATQLLPLTSDLIKLSKHIDSEMRKVRESLSECPSIQKWTHLASLSLGKVILFNKRRSGEASRMTVCNYSSRPMWSEQCTEELKKSLTDFERKLANQLTVVEIVGKRGRKVPVLLTEDAKMSIDKLIETRDDVHISKENPFVFARSGNSTANIRGHDCLRKICSDACLEFAENITSTKLRKYIATVCQVFNLSENEYDWLARHLGHDIRVHREYYRLHESAVELTKVSRLLIAVDKGEVNRFAGKKLEDINLEDMPTVEEESENEGENNEEMEEIVLENEVHQHGELANPKEGQSTTTAPYPVQVAPREAQPKTTKTSRRRPWSSDEKEAVLKFFKMAILRNAVPRKADCLKCLEEHPVLSTRTWTDVKFCVKTHLDRIKKIKK